MVEPLLGHRSYVAEWDEMSDAVVLRSNTPGPAGSLVVEFDGVTLALDASDPRLVNFIDVEEISQTTAATPAASLLRRLVGDDLADSIGGIDTTARNRPQRLKPMGSRSDQPVPARVARLAVALVGADAPGMSPDEVALSTVEALAGARQAGLFGDLPGAQERLHRAATVLAGMSADRFTQLDRSGRAAAADACEIVADLLPNDLAATLLELATQLRNEPLVVGSLPSGHQHSAGPGESELALALNSLPLMIADRLPSVVRTSNDEFEIRLTGWAQRTTGWWVRAFRQGGTVPLAAVPMLEDGLDAVAHLLLPPDDGALFELDIVDDPASVRLGAQLAAFRAAIASGQRAARLERLDRRDAAVHAWQRSSELHRQAGDEDRARQADAIVANQRAMSRRFGSPQVGATLADHLVPTS